MVMKETLAYYMNNNSTVHCVFLDASKAFDCVEYSKLFKLLTDRGMPSHVIRVLLNMYTGQQVRVLWNGIYSNCFSVSNGVKQGGIISPVLFCVYFDVLLLALRDSGVGCHIGQWFVGALAYADDIVLITPTARAMRKLLSICDEFAINYSMKFNANKSKCLMFRPNRLKQGGKSSTAPESPVFEIGCNLIENVDRWPHLGHVINTYLTDDDDILSRRNCLIGQANNFLCQFSKLDSVIKNRLFKTYCSSLYGCEIWDVSSKNIEDQSVL